MRSGEDGPLLFAMLLGNQNNNNGANGANNNQNNDNPEHPSKAATDTVQVLPSSTVLEYVPSHEASPFDHRECMSSNLREAMFSGEDGAIFAMLVGNQNNKNGVNGANNNQNNDHPAKPAKPATDTVQILQSSTALEYASPHERSLSEKRT